MSINPVIKLKLFVISIAGFNTAIKVVYATHNNVIKIIKFKV